MGEQTIHQFATYVLCGSSFNKEDDIKNHFSELHKGKKPFKCNKCNSCFIHNSAMKRHMFIHEGKKPFQCTHCGNSFNRRAHLNSHMLSFHIDKKKIKHRNFRRQGENSVKTEGTSFQCIICAKCFENKGQLKIHIESNHKKGK